MELTVRLALLATVLMVATVIKLAVKKKNGPLPPGPKGLPLVGNLFDLPTGKEEEWKHWLKHKDLYGPISSVTSMGTTIVILHDPQIAHEMFEKKSSIYSSRPKMVFGTEMIGWINSISLMPYGKVFAAHRKRIHTAIGTHSAVLPYLPLQEKEVHRFLLRVLREPDDLISHIRTEAGAIILKMIYGYTIEPHKSDLLVEIADRTLDQFSVALVPGTWLVDLIPALRYLPWWVPGAGFKKTAEAWRKSLYETVIKPYKFARRRIANGKSEMCYVANFGIDLSPEDDDIVKWTAFILYAGGSDTTVNVIAGFFLAMTLYPEVQIKAQEEIDRVVGSGRLPTLDDQDNLPYVSAVVKEAWRWHIVVPMGVAHAASEDYYVRGHFIPKGAMVMANVGWFTRDPSVYPNPSKFDPLRYMSDSPAPEATEWMFGFGRRICPGRFFAQTSVWLTIARALAVFNISKGLDESGREIEPVIDASPGIISRPGPYKASFKPRSAQHEALIRQAETLYPWEQSDSHELADIEV